MDKLPNFWTVVFVVITGWAFIDTYAFDQFKELACENRFDVYSCSTIWLPDIAIEGIEEGLPSVLPDNAPNT